MRSTDLPAYPHACLPGWAQDFLTSAYLLTSKDKFLTRAELCQLAGYMTGTLGCTRCGTCSY